MREVAVHVCHAPLRHGEVGLLFIFLGVGQGLVGGAFHRCGGAFVFHHELGVARAAGRGVAVHRDEQGQGCFHALDASVDGAQGGDFAVLHLLDGGDVSHLVEVELLCHLRAYLSRVAVDSLAAANHEVGHADLLNRLAQCVARGERIGTGKGAVGEQHAAIGSAIQSFADNVCGAGRSHRENGNRRAGVLVFEAQRLLEGVEVFGVENSRQGSAVHCSLRRHGIFANIARVRHLLGKNYDFKTHK